MHMNQLSIILYITAFLLWHFILGKQYSHAIYSFRNSIDIVLYTLIVLFPEAIIKNMSKRVSDYTEPSRMFNVIENNRLHTLTIFVHPDQYRRRWLNRVRFWILRRPYRNYTILKYERREHDGFCIINLVKIKSKTTRVLRVISRVSGQDQVLVLVLLRSSITWIHGHTIWWIWKMG